MFLRMSRKRALSRYHQWDQWSESVPNVAMEGGLKDGPAGGVDATGPGEDGPGPAAGVAAAGPGETGPAGAGRAGPGDAGPGLVGPGLTVPPPAGLEPPMFPPPVSPPSLLPPPEGGGGGGPGGHWTRGLADADGSVAGNRPHANAAAAIRGSVFMVGSSFRLEIRESGPQSRSEESDFVRNAIVASVWTASNREAWGASRPDQDPLHVLATWLHSVTHSRSRTRTHEDVLRIAGTALPPFIPIPGITKPPLFPTPPMRLLTYSLASLAAFSSMASAQLIDHTFDHGDNPDGWVAWDSQYSSVTNLGGAPLEHLILNNVGGPSTCHYVFVEPTGPGPFEHTGDWRAAGVESVTVDLETRAGTYGGIWCVFLVSDADTPSNPNDDCYLILIHPDGAPQATGWNHYEFDLPTAQTTAATGWFAGGACSTTDIDQVWNSIVTDVDRMFFVLDAAPGTGCAPTNWSLGIDNISVQRGTLGSVYCAGLPNSTGERSQIEGYGSTSIASNNVTLELLELPVSSFGYFLMSQSTQRVPVASGDLCLQAPIIRHSLSVLQANGSGRAQFSPDLTSLPQATVFQPGDTWNFQFWHRDSGATGPTANFSEGLTIQFE